jgi:hypothetical protein
LISYPQYRHPRIDAAVLLRRLTSRQMISRFPSF